MVTLDTSTIHDRGFIEIDDKEIRNYDNNSLVENINLPSCEDMQPDHNGLKLNFISYAYLTLDDTNGTFAL